VILVQKAKRQKPKNLKHHINRFKRIRQ
jgi:hypothetical protein